MDTSADLPRRVRRMIGVACGMRKENLAGSKRVPDIANPQRLPWPSSDSERWRVRRDGLITISRDGMEEEWLVDPDVVKTFESTGCWPTMTESATRNVRESDRFRLYGTVPSSEGGLLSAPVTIQWDITSGCNLRCKHCYSSSADSDPDELAEDEALRIIKEAYDIGVHSLHILGGEPFFRSDVIHLLQEASRLGLTCHVSSNGTLIDGSKTGALSGLTGLTVDVSLDSVDPQVHDWLRGKGAFHKAISGIHHLAKDGIRFSTTCTVNPRTLGQMQEVVDQAIRLGAYRVQFLIVSPIGRALDHEPELVLNSEQRVQFTQTLHALQAKHGGELIIDSPAASTPAHGATGSAEFLDEFVLSGCMAGIDKMAIRADGSVTACPHLKEVFGNVREASLDQIWANMHLKRAERLGWDCAAVPFNGICGGGCPAPERFPEEISPCSGRETMVLSPSVSEATTWCHGDCPFPCGCPSDCRLPCMCPGDCPFPCGCPSDCRLPCMCPSDCRCPIPCCPTDCSFPCMCPSDCRCPIPCCPSDCRFPCMCPQPF